MLSKIFAGLLAVSLGLNLAFLRSSSGWSRFTLATSWFLSSCLWKMALAQDLLEREIETKPFDWTWSTLNLWAPALLALILLGRRYLWGWWAVNAFFGSLFWFDLLYYRFFDDLPGLYLLAALGQGASSWPSAWAMHKTADIGLFFDLPVMLAIILLAGPDRKPVGRRTGVELLALVGIFNGISCFKLDEDRSYLLRLRFKNVAIVDEFGLINYHYYDLWGHIDPSLKNPFKKFSDDDLLREIIGHSRRSIDASSPYKGVARGRNLLMIQLESLQWFPVHLKVGNQKVMPFLDKFVESCLSAPLWDQSGQGRSSDGEFIYLNSLLPPGERPLVFAYPDNNYYGLPAVLAEHGYHCTYAVPYLGSFWNCRYMSQRYGFQKDWLQPDFPEGTDDEILGWGLTDDALYRRLIPRLVVEPQPFFTYLVTLMGHHPYKELSEDQEQLKLPAHLKGTMLYRYLQECRLRDDHLRKLISYLQASGLWDNTVLVLFGDHDARIPQEDRRLLDKPHFDDVDACLEDRVFFAVHCPGDFPRGELHGILGQVDAAPTLLHLLGIPSGETAMLGLNFFGPDKHQVLISKGGYGFDAKKVVVDEGKEMTGYLRSDHSKISAPVLEQRVRREMELCLDLLRLDMVPKIRAMKF